MRQKLQLQLWLLDTLRNQGLNNLHHHYTHESRHYKLALQHVPLGIYLKQLLEPSSNQTMVLCLHMQQQWKSVKFRLNRVGNVQAHQPQHQQPLNYYY